MFQLKIHPFVLKCTNIGNNKAGQNKQHQAPGNSEHYCNTTAGWPPAPAQDQSSRTMRGPPLLLAPALLPLFSRPVLCLNCHQGGGSVSQCSSQPENSGVWLPLGLALLGQVFSGFLGQQRTQSTGEQKHSNLMKLLHHMTLFFRWPVPEQLSDTFAAEAQHWCELVLG